MERARRRGLSTSQGRGHAKPSELPVARLNLWRRLRDWLTKPAATPPPIRAPAPPEPRGAPPVPPPEYVYVPPEESGIRPGGIGEFEDPYQQILFNMGLMDGNGAMLNPDAANAVYVGWYDPDATRDQRHDARMAFFEELGWDNEDFHWDEWREWYTETAA